jgi:hypothetical protein
MNKELYLQFKELFVNFINLIYETLKVLLIILAILLLLSLINSEKHTGHLKLNITNLDNNQKMYIECELKDGSVACGHKHMI